jgi:hypothetical protein
MTLGTREQAWEIVHHMFATGNGTSCNGRTFAQREQPYSGNGGLTAYGGIATAAMAVDIWKTNATLCPIVMTAAPTQGSAGVAREANDAYVIWFK